MRMTRAPYLVTLFSGDATREIAYGPEACGDIRRLDESAWDGPVVKPVERARIELKIDGAAPIVTELSGRVYLKLEEAGAIEGLIGAIARGRKPTHAIDYALLAAAT